MYVCMSVTDLRLKYTGLCIVYVPFGTCRLGCHRDRAMAWISRSRTRKIEDDARTSPDVWKTVNCSTKDERRQDNGDKKRLARHDPSDLLRSLTRERIGGGHHGVVSPALRVSPFRTFHVLRVRHLMGMRIPSFMLQYNKECAHRCAVHFISRQTQLGCDIKQ